MDDRSKTFSEAVIETDDLGKFTESYASFNRIINTLQRKYIELEEEFTAQHDELAQANRKLVDLSRRNLAATEFLNSLLDSISVGVVSIDTAGRITHFNPGASVMLGIPQQEPLRREYREAIPPGVPVEANVLRTFETGKELDGMERLIEINDGSQLHLSVSTALLKDRDGRSIGAVEILHDLTKMKKMEKEIVRLNTLAALGEMAATIAHEVRNPLSGISGFAALLERDLEEDDPRRQLVKKIIGGVNSLNETVATLLSYTRFEEMNRRKTEFDPYLATIIKQFKLDNNGRLEQINIEIDEHSTDEGEAVSLSLDPVLFRQVLFNVIGNAIDAMKGKGAIKISHRILPRQSALERYSEKVLLGVDETIHETTISDTGPGIPEDQLAKVFSPFFTTRQGGNGLGLAMALKIVRAHGGEMVAENNSDGGALFRMLLPIKISGTKREYDS